MDLQPHLRPSGEGGRERPIGAPEGFPGIHIRELSGIPRADGFHCVGQHIETRIRHQPLGHRFQQIAVQDRDVRPELVIHQRMLHLPMGQHGEVRHLRAGAGGGGDRYEGILPLGEPGHGLGAVHGAAAAQGDHQIRTEFPKPCRAFGRQLHCGIRLHLVEYFHRLGLRRIRYPLRGPVFGEEGVRDQKDPLRAQLRKGSHGPGSGAELRFDRELFHIPTAFSGLVLPGMGRSMYARGNFAGGNCLAKPAAVCYNGAKERGDGCDRDGIRYPAVLCP